jgi:hypothetical protein
VNVPPALASVDDQGFALLFVSQIRSAGKAGLAAFTIEAKITEQIDIILKNFIK